MGVKGKGALVIAHAVSVPRLPITGARCFLNSPPGSPFLASGYSNPGLARMLDFVSASFVSSARSLFRSFVGDHISAFHFCKSQFRERVSQSMISLRGLWPVPRLPVRRRKSVRSLPFAWTFQLRLRISIYFLLFQNPVGGFG